MTNILIVYSTWTGATRTVAEAIAEELRTGGIRVDVRRARKVRDIAPYQAVVVGASVHIDRTTREIRRFVRRHRRALGNVPVAYFVVCGTMIEDTLENRQKASGYLDQLSRVAPDVEPIHTGLFAGAVLDDSEEYERLPALLKSIARATASEMEDGRDWEAIRAWTQELRPLLAVE